MLSINPEPEQLDCMDMDQNWTERKTDLDPGLKNLDLTDMDTWTDLDKIGLDLDKFGLNKK